MNAFVTAAGERTGFAGWLVDVRHQATTIGLALAVAAFVLVLADLYGPWVRHEWRQARRRWAARRAVRTLCQDPDLHRRICQATAAVSAAQGEARAWAYGARFTAGRVQVLLAGDPGPVPSAFRATTDPLCWTVPDSWSPEPDGSIGEPDRAVLVVLGAHEGGALLLDPLRAPGPLVVAGPRRMNERLRTAISHQLPASEAWRVAAAPQDGPQWALTLDDKGHLGCPALGLEGVDVRGVSANPPGWDQPAVVTASAQEEQEPVPDDVTVVDLVAADHVAAGSPVEAGLVEAGPTGADAVPVSPPAAPPRAAPPARSLPDDLEAVSSSQN